LFGSNPTFEPGVHIATSGRNSTGQTIPLGSVAMNNCYDLDHSNTGWVEMYNGGAMNGADKIKETANAGCAMPPNPAFKFVDNSAGLVQGDVPLAVEKIAAGVA